MRINTRYTRGFIPLDGTSTGGLSQANGRDTMALTSIGRGIVGRLCQDPGNGRQNGV